MLPDAPCARAITLGGVISAVAFCPHPPLLVPAVAAGAADDLDGLRQASLRAIGALVATGDQLVLLGSGPASLAHSPLARGTLAGYGAPVEVHLGSPACGGDLELPLSLTVGAWLVREAAGPQSGALGFSVGPDFAGSRAAVDLLALAQSRDLAVLVLGDGTARRGVKAPGYLDERAAGFDETVLAALREGDAAALERLDAELGADLLAAGVPAWRAAGGLLDGTDWQAELLAADDPFGVQYAVALWTARR